MMQEKISVILVYSTSQAMQIEKALAATDIQCRMVPVPRHLSSDCGISIQINSCDAPKVDQMLKSANISVHGIFPV